MKPILVTGASGLFGGEIARQLLASGFPVRVFVRDMSRLPEFHADVEVSVGDFQDKAALAEAMKGVDKMFLASYDQPDSVSHQANVLAVAHQCGLRHVVRLSSDGTEENVNLPIFNWHAEGERQLQESGLTYTHLKPGWVMQNFESFVVDDAIRLPSADGRIGLVDHRDVAAVGVLALTTSGHEGRDYILMTESLSHTQIAEQLSQAMGRKISYQDIAPEVYQSELETADWDKPSIESMLGLFEEVRAVRNSDFDVTDSVEEVLGRPGILFAQYARDYAGVIGCKS
jgi:uncharacterized protein YbjT (DUF2867 family)